MAYLALVRHGQSEWNALGLWTGLRDIELNDIGRREAREAAAVLKGIHWDQGFASALVRAQQTLDEILTCWARRICRSPAARRSMSATTDA